MDLIQQVKNAGIIGAGGAGFPTHAKLGSPADYMLMNAAECEPLLRVDQQLLVVYTDRILIGFEAAAWYWHFVDVVWLFLFIAVYWWGYQEVPVS